MTTTNEQLVNLPVAKCIPTKDNPRVIDEKTPRFLDLVQSIKTNGVKARVWARLHPQKPDHYDLLAGERRLRAAKKAGLKEIPAILYAGLTDQEAFDLTLFENKDREQLTAFEEARAVEIAMKKYDGDLQAVAAKLTLPVEQVRLRLRLQELSPAWKDAIADEDNEVAELTARHLELIARLAPAAQDIFLSENLNGNFFIDWDTRKPITIKNLRSCILDYVKALSGAPFDVEDPGLVPAAGACSACAKRSDKSGQIGLWDDPEETTAKSECALCLDTACWDLKVAAAVALKERELKAKHKDLQFITTAAPYSVRFDALKESRPGLLSLSRVNMAKKTAKDRRPAMIVDGPKAGELVYVKSGLGTESAQSRWIAGESSEGKPTPLSTRRAALDSKRWVQVLRKLIAKIEETPLKDLVHDKPNDLAQMIVRLVSLAACFGTDPCQTDGNWDDYEVWRKARVENVLDQLWEAVRPTLTRGLHYMGGVTQLSDSYVEEARTLGALLNIDVQAMFDDVAGRPGFTEPKSWAQLNEDGTPKAAAKKGAKA